MRPCGTAAKKSLLPDKVFRVVGWPDSFPSVRSRRCVAVQAGNGMLAGESSFCKKLMPIIFVLLCHRHFPDSLSAGARTAGRTDVPVLARCPAAPCGVRQRTLRQVLEYSPQSTILHSARRLSVLPASLPRPAYEGCSWAMYQFPPFNPPSDGPMACSSCK